MDGLIEEGRQGGQGTVLGAQANRLSVDGNWLSWLASQRAYLSERYDISRDTQHGSWVVMLVRFDSGYVLTCYFRGVAPVILDHCSGNQ